MVLACKGYFHLNSFMKLNFQQKDHKKIDFYFANSKKMSILFIIYSIFKGEAVKKYKVSEECIACRACVEVAGDNFEINENRIAFLKKQPENEQEESRSQEAMEICPVEAISEYISEQNKNRFPVLASSNIKTTLDQYPELKPVLINLSPLFKRMQNPAMYNTLARFASFNDAAKMTGVSPQ